MKQSLPLFRYFILAGALSVSLMLPAQVPTLRLAFHIFQTDTGTANFHADSVREMMFLRDLEQWINAKAAKLDTLTPPVTSRYMPDAGFRIRVDSVFFHRDSHAWDCSIDIDAPYMRNRYVDLDSSLSYLQKYQTLPVFIGGNIAVVGGHSRNIGDKGYIGMRGFYQQYSQNQFNEAVEECAKNLLHEIGHTVGLMHNFRGGSGGDQCDQCEDNGCPEIGASNNIMDYWPSYGHALSECQVQIVQSHLQGKQGNISDVLVNDSCFLMPGLNVVIGEGDSVGIPGTEYLHGNMEIRSGGVLVVTGYLSVAAGCSILVEQGGKLLIDGGTIGNLCGDLWAGIMVTAADTVADLAVQILNEGVIENALVGLTCNGPALLNGERALFRNNVCGVLISSSDQQGGSINACDFRITRLLNHHEEGVRPEVFIRSWESRSLDVSDCSFINDPGTFLFNPDSSGIGVDFIGRQMSLRACVFQNLTVGIQVSADKLLQAGFNEFTNNRCGIQSLVGSSQTIEESLFRLQRLNDGPTYGIVLNGPGSYTLSHNRFESEFGSGQMAGIYLKNPGSQNSYIGSNHFQNLPVGILIHHPPDIEEHLLEWARRPGQDLSGLELGPVSVKNQYDQTPIRLMLMEDSLAGTIIGSPENIRLTDRIRADQWPVGGYYWYQDSCQLTAVAPQDITSVAAEQKHGFYTFMNLWDPGNDSLTGDDIDSLKKVLQLIGEMDARPERFFSDDLFNNLNVLEEIPMALRSARISAGLRNYSNAESRWYQQALSSLAGTFTHADSSLVSLRTLLHQPLPPLPPLNSSPVTGLPPWPAGIYYRFLPAPDFTKPLPAFDIRPIPASDCIYVFPRASYFPYETWRYEIISAKGQMMQSGSFPGWKSLKIDMEGFSVGIYFMRIFNSRTALGTQRFMILPK